MDYDSLKYTTSNEAGEYEVEMTYARGIWRRLLRMPAKREVYVSQTGGTVWYVKGSGKRAGTVKEKEICNVVEYVRQKKVYA